MNRLKKIDLIHTYQNQLKKLNIKYNIKNMKSNTILAYLGLQSSSRNKKTLKNSPIIVKNVPLAKIRKKEKMIFHSSLKNVFFFITEKV